MGGVWISDDWTNEKNSPEGLSEGHRCLGIYPAEAESGIAVREASTSR
jgi:hypothetical protein